MTLIQLKLADELCFPADLEKLLGKHLPQSVDREFNKQAYMMGFRHHKNNLTEFIFSQARSNRWHYELMEKIVADLLK